MPRAARYIAERSDSENYMVDKADRVEQVMLPGDNLKSWMGQAAIVLTYDDGRTNNYTVALPLHEKFRVPATFAIIAGRTLDPQWWYRHMTPWQVIDAQSRGVEISSHGYEHKIPLTDLSDEDLQRELRDSKVALEGVVGRGVETFCLPFSKYDDRVLAETLSIYRCIRVAGNKYNVFDRAKSKRGAKILSFSVRQDTTIDRVKEILQIGIENRSAIVLMFHGIEDGDVAKGKYNTTSETLHSILKVIVEAGEKNLLPLTLSELTSIAAGREDKVATVKSMPTKRKASGVPKHAKVRPEGRVLVENEDYMMTFYPSDTSEKLVISFGGLPSKLTKSGFGTRFIVDQGWSHVFVAQREGSQYQGLGLDDFHRFLAPVADGREVITYGSSLGGYCALYYAGCFDALAISSGPKNSVHPSMRKSRFEHVRFRHLDFDQIPVSSQQPVILYDPYRSEERLFIDNVVSLAYPEAVRVEFPFAGHTVLNTLKVNGVLKPFIRSIVDSGTVLRPALRTEKCEIWNAEVGRHLAQCRETERARVYLERSIAINPTKEATELMLRLLIKEKNYCDAQALVDHLTAKGHSALMRESTVRQVVGLSRAAK